MMWNTQNRYGYIAIFLHWFSALVIVGLFISGLWMVELGYYDSGYYKAPDLHKSIGISLLLLTLLRLVWKSINPRPKTLPGHENWQVLAAAVVHGLLYGLLLLVMISGYLISTANGRGIDVFGVFELSATLHGLDQQEDRAGVLHLYFSYVLIGFSILHMIAALKHHFWERDETLKRML